MSASPQRIWKFRAMHVLLAGTVLIPGACHQARSTPPQPKSIERRFPGADIVPIHHGAFLVRIHSGMFGDAEPLYVIDGTPLKIPPNRGIDWFKPDDIADIKVLKFPHELAEYGPNGANGVIVITTKQAPRRPVR